MKTTTAAFNVETVSKYIQTFNANHKKLILESRRNNLQLITNECLKVTTRLCIPVQIKF